MTEQHAQRANPFAQFGNKPYRMGGEKTPATTNPVTSRCTALRITVERGKGYPSYRFLAAGAFVYFPVDLNELFKPLVGDLRPEDDMKVNWSVTWFTNAQARRIVTKVADTTTGETLAQTNAQPALIETTVDEKTGQLATVKSKSPFGKPLTEEQKAQAQRDGEIARAKVAELQAAKERKAMNMPEEAADAILNEQMAEDIGDYNQRDDEAEKARINTKPIVKAAITQGKDDPTPTQSPDELETLVDHFPRTVTGEPMPDKALVNGKHWQKDHATRTKFFADLSGLCNKHQVPYAEHKRDDIRKAAQGVDHLEEYPGTPDELFAACKARIEAEYPLAKAQNEIAPKKGDVETERPTTPTNPVPAKNDAESGANSDTAIKMLQDTISALQKKINELESKQEPAKMTNPELPEAPFSANFHLRNKRDVRIQYTIRAQTVQDGTERVDALIDILLEKRGFVLDELPASRPSANGAAPAPASSASGESLCALIKVGKSYTGNKAQLQFECDGFDQPLRYTRDNLVQVLANAKQMNGNPFTNNDLTDGRKFGGEWMVAWEKGPGSDGKNHINVISVRNAA